FTTQDCSGCGKRVQKSLSTRTHVCPHCGLVLDRDENAAINILHAALCTLGHRETGSLARAKRLGRDEPLPAARSTGKLAS
ncbi:MAG TPA: zinc ribbon domain-containing protein, partial [Ktedonobacterales bacterium]